MTHPDLHLVFPILKTSDTKKSVSDSFVAEWRAFVKKNPYDCLDNWIEILSKENKRGYQGGIYKDEALSIQKKIALKNYEAKYSIVLIWMAEQMNREAANKLLKHIEEPPKRTIFLLITEHSEKLLSTIRSRLQFNRIKSFSSKDIVNYFGENKNNIDKVKQLIIQKEFNLGKIINAINKENDDTNFLELFSTWMRLMYKVDIIEISTLVNMISKNSKRYQISFLKYCTKMIRDCLIINFADKKMLSTSKDEEEFLEKFARFIHEENCILIFEELEDSIRALKRNANTKILFFTLSLQIIKMLKIKRNKPTTI